MSKVITFSRLFPAYHPRKGEPTYFVEKIWSGIKEDFSKTLIGLDNELFNFSKGIYKPKYHTIRAGNRWKVGDKFSPRVWSDKPYRSKQITISPDIEIKKVWEVKIEQFGSSKIISYPTKRKGYDYMISLGDVANNDGLSIKDFNNWFIKVPFIGQIICWNENINY